jgi:hypothetical protein
MKVSNKEDVVWIAMVAKAKSGTSSKEKILYNPHLHLDLYLDQVAQVDHLPHLPLNQNVKQL